MFIRIVIAAIFPGMILPPKVGHFVLAWAVLAPFPVSGSFCKPLPGVSGKGGHRQSARGAYDKRFKV